jgi:hypothetical protein
LQFLIQRHLNRFRPRALITRHPGGRLRTWELFGRNGLAVASELDAIRLCLGFPLADERIGRRPAAKLPSWRLTIPMRTG